MSTHRDRLVLAAISALAIAACSPDNGATPSGNAADALTVAATPSDARAPDGSWISWKEHLIDSEDVNGGVAIRGGDGIVLADLDRDGYLDVVTVQEDSNHLRVAYGSADSDKWVLRTIAEGPIVAAIEDVAAGDLNGDGWPDLVAACEEGHLAYFQNPGADARDTTWQSLIPPNTQGPGSWLRVFIVDMNGDGKPDLTAANKGEADIIRPGAGQEANRPTSLFTLHGPPLEPSSWREQELFREGIPNNAIPYDIDGDGDPDVLAGKRVHQQMVIIENRGPAADGSLQTALHPVNIAPAADTPDGWRVSANAFQADFADFNGDGRADIAVNVSETDPSDPHTARSGLAWLEQPETLDQPWPLHRIGETLPDLVIGIHLADVDGDGDLDAVTGGYSGLNILSGGYSGASRDFDEPSVTPAATVGRLTWFENPGQASSGWKRHDINRTVRGMYDMFVSRDMDGDGDLDIIVPRGNTGSYDGVFWLEQVRTADPRPAFTPARTEESRQLPLPPENWRDIYGDATTYTAPNKAAESH